MESSDQTGSMIETDVTEADTARADMIEPASEYRVLARKYRPSSFETLIGQGPMVKTLSNAFKTGRIAQAWMLTGVRGVGKTTTARILARALNYSRGADIDQPTIDLSEPGDHCQAIMEGRHIDVIEMDAASHTGIDDIRDITDAARYKPVSARFKVYIIDEVHMLSKSAFNGLLKTLEEPPAHVKFIFATTEIRKVPVTILSRCQRFDLRRVEAGTLIQHLGKIADAEKMEIEDEALALIARAGEGSVRDCLSLLDQAMAQGGSPISAEAVRDMLGLADRARIVDLFEMIGKGDIASALGEIVDQHDIGADPSEIISALAEFTHLVTRIKLTPEVAQSNALSEIERDRGRDFADKLSIRGLSRLWQMLTHGLREVNQSDMPLAAAEMVLIRVCHASDLPTPDDLIEKLQSGANSGGGQPSSSSQAPSAAPQASSLSAEGSLSSTLSEVAPPPASATVVHDSRLSPGRVDAPEDAAQSPRDVTPERAADDAPPLAAVVFSSLSDIAARAKQERDIDLYYEIRDTVRLISLEPGQIEISFAAPPRTDFAGQLTKKLQDWTGERWMVVVARDGGAATLKEAEESARNASFTEARANPLVQKMLDAFPGAEITRVTDLNDIADDPGPSLDEGDQDILESPDDEAIASEQNTG